MCKTKLSPPWITYVHKLEKMFENDSEIVVKYDDNDKTASLYVTSYDKAIALKKILKDKIAFGKVILTVEVIAPDKENADILDAFTDALIGNTAFEYAVPISSSIGTFNYVLFKNQVVQFFNDQLDDINGLHSTLYQEIAKDIFKDNLSVCYCTEPSEKNLSKPLGEWP